MKQYRYHIEPLSSETIDDNVKRFDDLGEKGWEAVGKFSLNHMLFRRKFDSSYEWNQYDKPKQS